MNTPLTSICVYLVLSKGLFLCLGKTSMSTASLWNLPYYLTLLYFYFSFGVESVTQAGLEVPGSSDFLASASQVAGIKDTCHYIWFSFLLYPHFILFCLAFIASPPLEFH